MVLLFSSAAMGLDIKADIFSVPFHSLYFSSMEPPLDKDLIPVKLGEQSLYCWIPPQDSTIKDASPEIEQENILELALDAISQMPCLEWNLGFWKYEYCPKKGISQFHQVPEKGIVLHYNLGNVIVNRELVTINDTHTFVFPMITLGSGTICDVSGEPRTTEIQIHCKEDAHDHISKISEVSTCRYLAIIYTPRICTVSTRFIPKTVVEERTITCFGSKTDGNIQSFFEKTPEVFVKEKESVKEEESSHGDLIDLAKKLLENNGFSLELINLEEQ
jgi:hypothetical protein